MHHLAQGAALNACPGKGTGQGPSLTLAFDVSFLWEVCPIPFPPQGERRAVWPFLGKFLRRPSPVPGREEEAHPLPGQPRGPFPPPASIKADSSQPSAPASAPFSALVWKHPQLTGAGSACPTQGWGKSGTAAQLGGRCAPAARPGRRWHR